MTPPSERGPLSGIASRILIGRDARYADVHSHVDIG